MKNDPCFSLYASPPQTADHQFLRTLPNVKNTKIHRVVFVLNVSVLNVCVLNVFWTSVFWTPVHGGAPLMRCRPIRRRERRVYHDLILWWCHRWESQHCLSILKITGQKLIFLMVFNSLDLLLCCVAWWGIIFCSSTITVWHAEFNKVSCVLFSSQF